MAGLRAGHPQRGSRRRERLRRGPSLIAGRSTNPFSCLAPIAFPTWMAGTEAGHDGEEEPSFFLGAEGDEAIQGSRRADGSLDCFVAALLAITVLGGTSRPILGGARSF